MNFVKSFVVASSLLLSSAALAADQPAAVPQKAKSATVVTVCQQLVVLIFVSPTGEVYIVDKDSGVPAATAKALAEAAEKTQVYDVGCPETDNLTTT